MAAFYGERTAAQKAFLAWDLGGPYWATLLRIRESPEFIAKMPKDIRVVTVRGLHGGFPYYGRPGAGMRMVHPADVGKFTKWMVPALLKEVEKDPKLGERLRAKEGPLKRFVTDFATDPKIWWFPEAKLVGPTVKGVGAVARPIGGAIGRTALYRGMSARYGPKLAGLFLSAKTRIARLGDAELSEMVAKICERLDVEAKIGGWSRQKVARVLTPLRKRLRPYSNTEISEAVLLLEKAEDMADYSRLVKARKLERASSNRVLGLAFGKGGLRQQITRPAFAEIRPAAAEGAKAEGKWAPVRGAMPGAEEAAARKRIRAAGGLAEAKGLPLKEGEYRLLAELQPERSKAGKLVGWEDPLTFQRVTPYRRRYMKRPGKVPAEEGKLPELVRPPGMRRPRQLKAPPVGRSRAEVEKELLAIVRREPRYQALYRAPETRELFAKAASKAAELKDPQKTEEALSVLLEMQGKFDRESVNRALSFLDSWGVTRVKQVFTLYNPAWYLKNYIDTVWVKNLLADVPVSKLHRYSRELPLDVFGRPVEWGGATWTKELTGLNPGKLTSYFMRAGNWIENTGRRAVGDLAYWREIEARGGREALKKGGAAALKGAHEAAAVRARRAVAQVHFDYSALSKTDEVLRRIFPFWMYQKNQLRWMVEQAATRPRLVYGGMKFLDLGERRGGPEVRLPGTVLKVQFAQVLSPEHLMKAIGGALAGDERERKRWESAGPLGRWLRRGEKWGFYAHPFLEQGLSGLLKGGDLMEDRSWKGFVPVVAAVGKIVGRDVTYIGVWRTVFPEYAEAPRIEQLRTGLKRRVMMRRAFSILEGKPMSLAQAKKYVGREMQVAGVAAFFGLYPQVREPKYDEMQELLKRHRELSFERKQEFREAHPEIGMYLTALTIRQR